MVAPHYSYILHLRIFSFVEWGCVVGGCLRSGDEFVYVVGCLGNDDEFGYVVGSLWNGDEIFLFPFS